MIYKTCVIDNASKAKKMAASIETKVNRMVQDGWEFVTFSMTNSGKAILIFRMSAKIYQEETVPDHGAPTDAVPVGAAPDKAAPDKAVPEHASAAAAAEIAGRAE